MALRRGGLGQAVHDRQQHDNDHDEDKYVFGQIIHYLRFRVETPEETAI